MSGLGWFFEAGEAKVVRPFRMASAIALFYLVLCSLYIWLSGEFAAQTAESVAELQSRELLKGLSFIFVTGLLFWLFAWLLLRRIADKCCAIEAQQKVILTSQKRALSGMFAASIAHDINNILSIFGMALFKLNRLPTMTEEDRALLQTMNDAEQRLTTLTQRLMMIGHESTDERIQPCNLSDIVHENVEFVKSHKRVHNCRLDVRGEGDVKIFLYPQMISQMLINLILNAADATGGTGTVEIRMETYGDHVAIEVHDDGPGIPEEARARIFDFFFTTKADGHGLGLVSVRACIEMHRGLIEVTNSPLGGACFRVLLPLGEPDTPSLPRSRFRHNPD